MLMATISNCKEYRRQKTTDIGRVERRRDRFRPMASAVSALSSIVATGHQVLPTFPPPSLIILYSGYSRIKCGVEGQKGRIHWGFWISHAIFYFEHDYSLRLGLAETGPVCSN